MATTWIEITAEEIEADKVAKASTMQHIKANLDELRKFEAFYWATNAY